MYDLRSIVVKLHEIANLSMFSISTQCTSHVETQTYPEDQTNPTPHVVKLTLCSCRIKPSSTRRHLLQPTASQILGCRSQTRTREYMLIFRTFAAHVRRYACQHKSTHGNEIATSHKDGPYVVRKPHLAFTIPHDWLLTPPAITRSSVVIVNA